MVHEETSKEGEKKYEVNNAMKKTDTANREGRDKY